jgi:hypothetical protein
MIAMKQLTDALEVNCFIEVQLSVDRSQHFSINLEL